MWLEISPSIIEEFPGLEVRLVKLSDVRVKSTNINTLNDEIESVTRRVRSNYSLDSLKDVELVRYYRDFFWRIGLDPTKTRPSAEALMRRLLLGKPFPRVNPLVDAYNLASVMSLIPIAAFDFDLLKMNLLMRTSREGELFYGIGMNHSQTMTGKEIVVQDREKLIAIYPYRDAETTKVTEKTVNTLIMVCGAPKVPAEKLERATELVVEYITRFCGGNPSYTD